jgi:catechol 2,3-dioxygenase-like lactoylglutathione lyase family enzyme
VSGTFSHIAMCVSDLERSATFYEGLGFRRAVRTVHCGSDFAALLEMDDTSYDALFLRNGAVQLELIQYELPETIAPGRRLPMNTPALTHVSIMVDDLEGACRTVEGRGGTVLRGTWTDLGEVDGKPAAVVFTLDPDGIRVELVQQSVVFEYET